MRVDIQNQGVEGANARYLDALTNLRGVADAILIAEEQTIYLKVDASVFDYPQSAGFQPPRQPAQAAPQPANNFDSFDDDIPF